MPQRLKGHTSSHNYGRPARIGAAKIRKQCVMKCLVKTFRPGKLERLYWPLREAVKCKVYGRLGIVSNDTVEVNDGSVAALSVEGVTENGTFWRSGAWALQEVKYSHA